jgi:hypothetical protein
MGTGRLCRTEMRRIKKQKRTIDSQKNRRIIAAQFGIRWQQILEGHSK